MKHTVLITGAAGYVGTMLVRRLAAREDVERIIGIDKEPLPELIKNEPKLVYLEMNTADAWEESSKQYAPDILIHTAWQIREMYGNQALEWEWNIGGSDKVFDFAFSESSVERLIHFSTVASYGAYPTNTIEQRFFETDPFRPMDYLYSEEKRVAEQHLEEKYARSTQDTQVAIVRPAAITGSRGRYMRIRFGLQSALSGQLKDFFVYRVISSLVAFVPVTPKWLRQFVHEDDVVNIVEKLAFDNVSGKYEAFNLCPPGAPVLGPDMANAVGKRTLKVAPWMVRLPFFFFWHLTRGKIPTGRGAWKSYSYPIAVDGSKVTKLLGYQYLYPSLDAFQYTNGEYEEFVPVENRRSAEQEKVRAPGR